MVSHYETCQNNNFLTTFYGEQYINQLYNPEEKPSILSYDEVVDKVHKLDKFNFVSL